MSFHTQPKFYSYSMEEEVMGIEVACSNGNLEKLHEIADWKFMCPIIQQGLVNTYGKLPISVFMGGLWLWEVFGRKPVPLRDSLLPNPP